MGGIAGLVVKLSDDRSKTLSIRLKHDNDTFDEPVPKFSSGGYSILICFIVLGNCVTHIAMGKKGRSAGTDMTRLNMSKIETLPYSLPIKTIVEAIPDTAIAGRVNVCFEQVRGGRFTDGGIRAVIEAIQLLDPDLSRIISKFSLITNERLEKLSTMAKQNLASQKDALLSVLRLAGLPEDFVDDWVLPKKPIRRYCDGLPKKGSIKDEASIIRNDFMCFNGMDRVMDEFNGDVVKFKSGSVKLHVYWADRNELELQTGTDLIYYNETFQSFVMVQYKLMDINERGRPAFRYSDPQLAKEVCRMNNLWDKFNTQQKPGNCFDFRFCYNPFFFKLCPKLVFEPESPHLIKGMYIPLDYWHLLAQSTETRGPHGGPVISYENVGRYLNNTEFAAIVSKAWVGCRPEHSKILLKAVKQSLKRNRTAILAIKKQVPDSYQNNNL
ncbi:hypothetical protein C4J81_03040 [Deltaproteobacteria bacterium Smac51]|nr:hypothetical protein C4J81_03040 [Deltaproteobacteria bacterium Smac51]